MFELCGERGYLLADLTHAREICGTAMREAWCEEIKKCLNEQTESEVFCRKRQEISRNLGCVTVFADIIPTELQWDCRVPKCQTDQTELLAIEIKPPSK